MGTMGDIFHWKRNKNHAKVRSRTQNPSNERQKMALDVLFVLFMFDMFCKNTTSALGRQDVCCGKTRCVLWHHKMCSAFGRPPFVDSLMSCHNRDLVLPQHTSCLSTTHILSWQNTHCLATTDILSCHNTKCCLIESVNRRIGITDV